MATTKKKAPKAEQQAGAEAPAAATQAQGPAQGAGDTPPGPEANLWQRLHWVMARLGYLPKSGTNEHFQYAYTTEAETVGAVRRLLVPARLAFSMRATDQVERRLRPTRKGDTVVTAVLLEFTLVNIDSPEDRYSTTLWAEGEDPSDKGFWKAYSGAVKYFWFKHLLIATGLDDPEATGADDVGQGGSQGGNSQGGGQQGKAPTAEQVLEWRTETIGLGYSLQGAQLPTATREKVERAMQAARVAEEPAHVGKALRYVRTVAETMAVAMDTEAYSQAEMELAGGA